MLQARCPKSVRCCSAAPCPRPRIWRSDERPSRTKAASVSTIERAESPGRASPPPKYFKAGPSDPAPSYEDVDNKLVSKFVQGLFRRKMVAAIGGDVPEQGYDGIIALTRKLNGPTLSARETQLKTIGILKSFFPAWLPISFQIFFGRPFPSLACQMNALATKISCEWLMGKVTINDTETDSGKIGKAHGVLVERCRYLEEAGCASICINSCKVPTQEFFAKTMGLPLTMTPNYENFSCQFAFGKTPEPQSSDEAFGTPCFAQCPSKRKASPSLLSNTSGTCSGKCPGIVLNTEMA